MVGPLHLEEYATRDEYDSGRRFELVKIVLARLLEAQPGRDPLATGLRSVQFADAVLAAMGKTPSNVSPLRTIQTKLREALTQNADACAGNPTTDERVRGYREGDDASIRMTLRLIDEAMERTDDAGPSDKELTDVEPMESDAETEPEAISPTEKPVTAAAIIPLIRQRMQNELADQLAIHAKRPTGDERVQQYRDGVEDGLEGALAIVNETEPEGPRPTCRETLRVVRCSVQSYLDRRLSYYGENPVGDDQRVLGHRGGVQLACNDVLELIADEMAKSEAETNDAETK